MLHLSASFRDADNMANFTKVVRWMCGEGKPLSITGRRPTVDFFTRVELSTGEPGVGKQAYYWLTWLSGDGMVLGRWAPARTKHYSL